MSIPEHIESFVITIRTLAMNDTTYHSSSRKSILKLMIMIKDNLDNPDNRIPVLQMITGLPISSQNNLTQHYTSVLINELLNLPPKSTILYDIEKLVEGATGKVAWEIYPRTGG